MNQIKNLQQNINIQEAISTITEFTIIGDKNNQDLFEYEFQDLLACSLKRKILKKTTEADIIIKILSSVSMLFTNINNNLIVLLSLPQLNEFIIFDYNLKKEEIPDYYINFIKIISNKLNAGNIQLFFNSKYCQFPLLLYSQNFYNSPDNLTRIYTRHLLLHILQITQESKLSPILVKYLQSYPFLQVLANHMQFMRELFAKTKEKHDNFEEELGLMDHFFKDLSQIVPQLKQILDNLIMQIIILPQYKEITNIKDDQKTQCFNTILHFLQNDIYVSERLQVGIFSLIFLHEIPEFQIFEIELNYLPVQDPEIREICLNFFKNSSNIQESRFMVLEKLNYTLSLIPYLSSYYSKSNPKYLLFEELLKNDVVSILLMSNNLQYYKQQVYNLYNIYTFLDCLNEGHYLQVLDIMLVLIMNKHIFQMTSLQKVSFLINLINIMINESENKINTIENCKKSIQIVKELISNYEKRFMIAFMRCNVLKKIEIHFINSESLYYKYFFKIQQCVEDENIEVFKKKPETHQIIRFFMFLNVILEQGWLANPFKKINYNLTFEPKSFKNGQIKLINCQAIIENNTYELEELEVMYDQEQKKVIIVNLINENENYKVEFEEAVEQEEFLVEFQMRQKYQEQHFVPETLRQLNKLYL
ncbi:unnamed protein product (macronuclear) [Paramecium tetraurelia]|uniref:FPL domain-containing protein n=1 Tax=Paramecium tetraurelia TaxID=5888 RepID=A0C850_PARTE|nr:uncharacterized protein GSPATT00036098001 [Paramecium tetraurelia]CAK66967.1 unnamed protein product [Paramecium tetraurelia]|eukprot:XP_001434364.1 hypothetical protein (macronuclear) [Paramecium tetraurelia strain d4-2]